MRVEQGQSRIANRAVLFPLPKGKFIDVVVGDRRDLYEGRTEDSVRTFLVRPAVRLDPAPQPSLRDQCGDVMLEIWPMLIEFWAGVVEGWKTPFVQRWAPIALLSLIAIGCIAFVCFQLPWGLLVRGR